MKEIKNRINSSQVTNPNCEIFYISSDLGENGEIVISPKRKHLALETFQVISTIRKETINDLSSLDLNATGIVESALENEMNLRMEKMIKDTIRYAGECNYKIRFTKLQYFLNKWFSYVPKKRIKNNYDIYKILLSESKKIGIYSRMGNADYIIVSPGLGSRIMEMEQFVFSDPNQQNLDQITGHIYKIGQIGNSLSVLIDPYMKYDDLTVIMGKNNVSGSHGVYLVYMDPPEKSESYHLGPDLIEYKTICLRKRYSLYPTENAHLQFLTFELAEKPHNIFTHLYKKIFDIK